MRINIEEGSSGIILKTEYDPQRTPLFNSEMKNRVPASKRKWDSEGKVWIFALDQGATLSDMLMKHFGHHWQPTASMLVSDPITQELTLYYLAIPKDYGDGHFQALGKTDLHSDWNLIFPLEVLTTWFGVTGSVGSTWKPSDNYYVLLGVRFDATPEEIKKAYRRAAKTWHPDINDDPMAEAMFKAVNEANEALSDPVRRKRYNAGLYFSGQVSGETAKNTTAISNWRPPVRCGYLTVKGLDQLGRFVIQEILKWDSISDGQGRELVTWWNLKEKTINEGWV